MGLLSDTLAAIRPVDDNRAEAVQRRLDNKTKPPGSLGRLEELAKRVCLITGEDDPDVSKMAIFVFAGDHGVTDEGVSAYPKVVTAQMVLNFIGGGAGVNVLARHVGADVIVADIGVDHEFTPVEGLRILKVARGTRNMAKGPAMTHEEAVRAVEAGIGLVNEFASKGYGLIGTGDMGIGNTTPSAAIASVFTGLPVELVTGYGTGITDAAFDNKVAVIKKAIEVNGPDPADALDVLAKVGGLEIAGIAGVVLGAAANRIPVVVDGFISTAGALVACELSPDVKGYIIAAHKSVEAGHTAMLDRIGHRPLVDLGMRLGEGTGAALVMGLVDAGVKVLKEMATFEQAGVEGEKIS
ncbi:MAG TPA: nicotinate-nucleotide--dimethylbenzimidazole phosphoribosyltransferase [Nitrospirota bacterium]